MKVQKYKGITGTPCDCPECVNPKPRYYIRINGYDIRKFNYSEYVRLKKELRKEEPDFEDSAYEYCVTSDQHTTPDSCGWNSFDNLIIASSDYGDTTIVFNITEEIESGTSYSDIKQRIDLIVDIGNAVMETLNKRK